MIKKRKVTENMDCILLKSQDGCRPSVPSTKCYSMLAEKAHIYLLFFRKRDGTLPRIAFFSSKNTTITGRSLTSISVISLVV